MLNGSEDSRTTKVDQAFRSRLALSFLLWDWRFVKLLQSLVLLMSLIKTSCNVWSVDHWMMIMMKIVVMIMKMMTMLTFYSVLLSPK